MVYLLYNRDILVGKKAISMSFKENAYQQMSFTDSFSGLTAREHRMGGLRLQMQARHVAEKAGK